MSSVKKEKSTTKRNYDKEAELQVQILEQKSRENYLTQFSQCDDDSVPTYGSTQVTGQTKQRSDSSEPKACIPVNAKAILEKWMYDHRLYCYPTKLEKQALSIQTGLSIQKISNWFINSRRRTLPKVLEVEGKSADNFTISRKKKTGTTLVTLVSSITSALNDDGNSLSDYANQEESKIIDQNSIFYGDGFNTSITEHNDLCYDEVLQDIIAPYIEPLNRNPSHETSTKPAHNELEHEPISDRYQTMTMAQQTSESKSSSIRAYRGILYEKSTNSKCIYIVVDSPS